MRYAKPARRAFTTPHIAALLLVAATADPARAARPLITDDARVVDAHACQVETWIKRNHGSTEYWALPACNFTGNLELTLGGARTRDRGDDSATYSSDVQMQGKTLFRPLETNGWGMGLVAGTVRHPQLPSRDWFAYVPTSFSFVDDRFVVHTNIGWLRDGESSRHRMTWGVGSETRLADRTWLIAEVFGQHQGKPSHQIGLRHWIVADRIQVDLTYGNRSGERVEDRWFSIGLRLLTPAFLPGVR